MKVDEYQTRQRSAEPVHLSAAGPIGVTSTFALLAANFSKLSQWAQTVSMHPLKRIVNRSKFGAIPVPTAITGDYLKGKFV